MIAMTPTREVEEAFRIAQEVLRHLAALPVELRQQVLEYAEILSQGTARIQALHTFLDLEEEDARGITAALFIPGERGLD